MLTCTLTELYRQQTCSLAHKRHIPIRKLHRCLTAVFTIEAVINTSSVEMLFFESGETQRDQHGPVTFRVSGSRELSHCAKDLHPWQIPYSSIRCSLILLQLVAIGICFDRFRDIASPFQIVLCNQFNSKMMHKVWGLTNALSEVFIAFIEPVELLCLVEYLTIYFTADTALDFRIGGIWWRNMPFA